MRGWSDFNLPPGVYNSDPYFTQEDGDVCEHSEPICQACQEEDDRAKMLEEPVNVGQIKELMKAYLATIDNDPLHALVLSHFKIFLERNEGDNNEPRYLKGTNDTERSAKETR